MEKLLLVLLLDYLAGVLSRAEVMRKGLLLINQHFDALVKEITQYYSDKGLQGTPTVQALKARKSKIEAEFLTLLDTEEAYWKSEEGLKQGAALLAILAIFSASAAVTESVAEAEGAVLMWKTMEDPEVCPLCEELEGSTYAPGEVKPDMPLHLNCRCYWLIVFEEGR